jgi:hypothetical protein
LKGAADLIARKRLITRIVGTFLFLAAFPAGRCAWAQDSELPGIIAENPAQAPKGYFDPGHLKGRWGIGISYMTNFGTALVLRHWYSDNGAFELLFGGYDTPQAGEDFSDNYTTSPGWGYGAGLGLKRNLAMPVENVFIQGAARLTFSQSYQQNSYDYNLRTYQYQDLVLFVGPGFEAFIPFWKNLSVEGSIGLYVSSRWSQTESVYNPAQYSSSNNTKTDSWIISCGLKNNMSSLVNMTVNFYF